MTMSKAAPAAAASRRLASASRPPAAVDVRMPHPSVCHCSPVRLMAESSTISTRSPLRSLAGGSARGTGASGSRSSNQNVDPAPGVLSTPIRPPINSTRRLEIARPRPVPPYFRVVEASAWLNSVNSRVRASSPMPIPVSVTAIRSAASVSQHVPGHLDQDMPALGELDGVGHQVEHDLPDASWVAHHVTRQSRIDADLQLERLGLRRRAARGR